MNFTSAPYAWQGCISSKTCPKCGVDLVCNSSGKAGIREGNTRYILGPCCCALSKCSECGHDWGIPLPKTIGESLNFAANRQNHRLDRIFEMVVSEVWGAGGDGDGLVAFHTTKVTDAAQKFEEWMASNPFLSRNPYKRHDLGPDHVLFSDESNENIVFVSADLAPSQKAPWRPEVYLEVW